MYVHTCVCTHIILWILIKLVNKQQVLLWMLTVQTRKVVFKLVPAKSEKEKEGSEEERGRMNLRREGKYFLWLSRRKFKVIARLPKMSTMRTNFVNSV